MIAARRSMAWMSLFAILWAVAESLGGALERRYSPFQVVWTRYAVHILLMLLVWGWRTPRSLWQTDRLAFQLARSSLMVCMPAAFIFGRATGTDYGTFMAIFWVAPLMLLGLAAAFLGERATILLGTLSALATGGAWLLTTRDQLPAPVPIVLALAMAFSLTLYVVMTRSLRTERTRTNLFYTAFGVLLALSPFMPSIWVRPSGHDVAIMAAIGLLGFVALWALDRMASLAPVSVTVPFLALQPMAVVIVGLTQGFAPSGRRIPVATAAIVLAGAITWTRARTILVGEVA